MSTRDIEKTLRTQAQMYRQMGNDAQGETLDRAADEIKTLRMADDLHQQGTEEMRDEVGRLRGELAALKEAARPVVDYYKWLAISEEDAFEPGEIIIGSSFQSVTKEQLDTLAALVGEEQNACS